MKRRTFLRCAGTLAAGWSLAGGAEVPVGSAVDSGEEFPLIDPAEVHVDAQRLSKAVDFINAEMKAGSIVGASLVATRRGRKFVEHYCGVYTAADGQDKPYDRTVLNPLFSFSKGVSATVAVMAHQDGLIDYDVPVSTYIPEYKGGDKDKTTLRHLFTHSAGIPSLSYGALSTEENWREFVAKACEAPIEWPVGSRTAYHGVSGLFLVAEAVRRVSGNKPWDTICRERLLGPIGAKSMTFGIPSGDAPVSMLPGYYTSLEPGKFGLAGHPAGGCFGTVDDMLRVLNLIVQGGTWHGQTLIKPDALKEMLRVQYADAISKDIAEGKSPAHEPWGLGWLVRGTDPKYASYWFGFGDSKSPTLFGHAGVDTIYGDGDPARELAFVFAMTNKSKDSGIATRLRKEVSNLLQDAVV